MTKCLVVSDIFRTFVTLKKQCKYRREGPPDAAGPLSNIIPRKIFKGMIELYLSKVTETSESEQAGKLYARVDYKESLDIEDMAHHMAEQPCLDREVLAQVADFQNIRAGFTHSLPPRF